MSCNEVVYDVSDIAPVVESGATVMRMCAGTEVTARRRRGAAGGVGASASISWGSGAALGSSRSMASMLAVPAVSPAPTQGVGVVDTTVTANPLPSWTRPIGVLHRVSFPWLHETEEEQSDDADAPPTRSSQPKSLASVVEHLHAACTNLAFSVVDALAQLQLARRSSGAMSAGGMTEADASQWELHMRVLAEWLPSVLAATQHAADDTDTACDGRPSLLPRPPSDGSPKPTAAHDSMLRSSPDTVIFDNGPIPDATASGDASPGSRNSSSLASRASARMLPRSVSQAVRRALQVVAVSRASRDVLNKSMNGSLATHVAVSATSVAAVSSASGGTRCIAAAVSLLQRTHEQCVLILRDIEKAAAEIEAHMVETPSPLQAGAGAGRLARGGGFHASSRSVTSIDSSVWLGDGGNPSAGSDVPNTAFARAFVASCVERVQSRMLSIVAAVDGYFQEAADAVR